MRRPLLLAALATAAVLAVPPASASARSCGHVEPIRGSDTGTFTTSQIDATHVQTDDVATGRATHVGRYTLHASEVIDLVTLAVTQGTFTVTGPGGETLSGRYSRFGRADGGPGRDHLPRHGPRHRWHRPLRARPRTDDLRRHREPGHRRPLGPPDRLDPADRRLTQPTAARPRRPSPAGAGGAVPGFEDDLEAGRVAARDSSAAPYPASG